MRSVRRHHIVDDAIEERNLRWPNGGAMLLNPVAMVVHQGLVVAIAATKVAGGVGKGKLARECCARRQRGGPFCADRGVTVSHNSLPSTQAKKAHRRSPSGVGMTVTHSPWSLAIGRGASRGLCCATKLSQPISSSIERRFILGKPQMRKLNTGDRRFPRDKQSCCSCARGERWLRLARNAVIFGVEGIDGYPF